jgi:hypothetical protein
MEGMERGTGKGERDREWREGQGRERGIGKGERDREGREKESIRESGRVGYNV